jgi:predicted ester cyclase
LTVSITVVVTVETEDNKELVRRFYREAIRERDAGACERLLGVDFIHNGERRGRPAQRQVVEGFLAAFPDLGHRIEQILAEGELVAAHQRWVGTHGGEFLGVGATGRRIEFTSTAVLRVRDGLIVQAWDEMDSGAILNQMVS